MMLRLEICSYGGLLFESGRLRTLHVLKRGEVLECHACICYKGLVRDILPVVLRTAGGCMVLDGALDVLLYVCRKDKRRGA